MKSDEKPHVKVPVAEYHRLKEFEEEVNRLSNIIWKAETHLREAANTLIADRQDRECLRAYDIIWSAFKGRDNTDQDDTTEECEYCKSRGSMSIFFCERCGKGDKTEEDGE